MPSSAAFFRFLLTRSDPGFAHVGLHFSSDASRVSTCRSSRFFLGGALGMSRAGKMRFLLRL